MVGVGGWKLVRNKKLSATDIVLYNKGIFFIEGSK